MKFTEKQLKEALDYFEKIERAGKPVDTVTEMAYMTGFCEIENGDA